MKRQHSLKWRIKESICHMEEFVLPWFEFCDFSFFLKQKQHPTQGFCLHNEGLAYGLQFKQSEPFRNADSADLLDPQLSHICSSRVQGTSSLQRQQSLCTVCSFLWLAHTWTVPRCWEAGGKDFRTKCFQCRTDFFFFCKFLSRNFRCFILIISRLWRRRETSSTLPR